MNKTVVASAVAGAICAAVGFGVGRTTAPSEGPAEGERIVAAADYDSLIEDRRTARDSLAALQDEVEDLRRRRAELAERADRAERALAERESGPAGVADANEVATGESTLVVEFGDWGDLPELRDADWLELATAAIAINELVKPVYDDIEAGRSVSPTAQRAIQNHNQKLAKHAVELMDKVPSHAPMAANGEFTHPVNLINLIAAMLENAGVPLTPGQLGEISAIGGAYDREAALLDGSYDESTWELTRILDELALKRDIMLEVENRLRAEQRAVVAIPKIQNRLRLDVLSPVNMVILNVAPAAIESREQLRGQVVEFLAEAFGLPASEVQAQVDLLEGYEADVDMILAPVQREVVPFAHLDDIIVAGRAVERLLRDFAERVTLSEETLLAMRDLQSWRIPVLIESGAETP